MKKLIIILLTLVFAIIAYSKDDAQENNFIAKNIFPGEKVIITGGTFQMGSITGASNEIPLHNVTLSDFSMSKYEITNAQYATFMNAIGATANGSFKGIQYLNIENTSAEISYKDGHFIANAGKENYPVIMVSWFGAKAYAEYYGGRLPTEAEWEFAARGGINSSGYTYAGSDTIDNVAWYYTNANNTTHLVSTKKPNELGIYDMTGNVWEWTNDYYDENYYDNSASSNPKGSEKGIHHVIRGGSWNYEAFFCRVTFRGHDKPTLTYNTLGFRPVFVP